mmetsp:Transcript_40398/g.87199  ORF Transcript_40398/g.87199 Transcript_40398/m.87199 type:complete len:110 (+) Transcript_40398:1237-1566(+)
MVVVVVLAESGDGCCQACEQDDSHHHPTSGKAEWRTQCSKCASLPRRQFGMLTALGERRKCLGPALADGVGSGAGGRSRTFAAPASATSPNSTNASLTFEMPYVEMRLL